MSNAAEKARQARAAQEKKKRQAEKERVSQKEEKQRERQQRREDRAEFFHDLNNEYGPHFLWLIGIFAVVFLASVTLGVLFCVTVAQEMPPEGLLRFTQVGFYVSIGLLVASAAIAIAYMIVGVSGEFGWLILSSTLSMPTTLFLLITMLVYHGTGQRDIRGFLFDQETGIRYLWKLDDTLDITHYEGNATDLVIPESYQGRPVTFIKENVFANNLNLETLTFQGATGIGGRAFYGCRSLTTVTFASGNIRLYEHAFADCPWLANVYGNQANLMIADSNPFSHSEGVELHIRDGGVHFGYSSGDIGLDSFISALHVSGAAGDYEVWGKGGYNELIIEDGTDLKRFSFRNIESHWNNYYHPMAKVFYLPASVSNIPAGFFGDTIQDSADYRVQIHYGGTEAQWKEVRVSDQHNDIWKNGNYDITYGSVYSGN